MHVNRFIVFLVFFFQGFNVYSGNDKHSLASDIVQSMTVNAVVLIFSNDLTDSLSIPLILSGVGAFVLSKLILEYGASYIRPEVITNNPLFKNNPLFENFLHITSSSLCCQLMINDNALEIIKLIISSTVGYSGLNWLISKLEKKLSFTVPDFIKYGAQCIGSTVSVGVAQAASFYLYPEKTLYTPMKLVAGLVSTMSAWCLYLYSSSSNSEDFNQKQGDKESDALTKDRVNEFLTEGKKTQDALQLDNRIMSSGNSDSQHSNRSDDEDKDTTAAVDSKSDDAGDELKENSEQASHTTGPLSTPIQKNVQLKEEDTYVDMDYGQNSNCSDNECDADFFLDDLYDSSSASKAKNYEDMSYHSNDSGTSDHLYDDIVFRPEAMSNTEKLKKRLSNFKQKIFRKRTRTNSMKSTPSRSL
ncbi:MAG: hypothetical protein HAW62_01535 [Endozoicomonadaceae bacterium]|nr:hypothetical protein [Endozoicomonadaceae bacterium]